MGRCVGKCKNFGPKIWAVNSHLQVCQGPADKDLREGAEARVANLVVLQLEQLELLQLSNVFKAFKLFHFQLNQCIDVKQVT